MGKSIKRNGRRRIRKTRRHKLKGGRKTEAALYVWKNPDNKTFQKRIFVKQGMDYGESIADAGYQMRFFNGDFGDTIPRIPDTEEDGNLVIHNINPYVKYLTADYSDGDVDEIEGAYAETGDKTYVPPLLSAATPMNVDKTKLASAFDRVTKQKIIEIAIGLGIKDDKGKITDKTKIKKSELISSIILQLTQP
jgi:hypothetical protein